MAKQYSFESLIQVATEIRHHLHQHPELTWHEAQTGDFIRQQLSDHQISWRPCAQHGAVATLGPESGGKHIALRGDMDALPICEASGVDWTSQQPDVMHACGHDGHTAALLATAFWLKQHEDQLSGPVSLLFQPAEEGGHGAKAMIEDGALEGVDEIYGWHNWPAIAYGQAICPPGAVMAGNGSFTVTVQGVGGHASQPEHCRDPLLAGAAIVQAIQQLVSRRFSPHDKTVVSITRFQAGEGLTVIPDTAHLAGSFRIARPDQRQPLIDLFTDVAEATAKAYGCQAQVEFQPRYSVTMNHDQPAQTMRSKLVQVYGDDAIDQQIAVPIMASEDFSYYLEEVPGAFALIGADDGGRSTPCHSPHYDFNDKLLGDVVRVFSSIVGVTPVKSL